MNFLEYLTESNRIEKILGTAGPIPKTRLLDSSVIFKDSYDKLDEIKTSGRWVNFDQEFQNDLAYKVYLNYINSMFGEIPRWNNGEIRLDGYHTRDKEKKYPKYARGFIGWMDQLKTGKFRNPITNSYFPIKGFKTNNNYLFGIYIDISDLNNNFKLLPNFMIQKKLGVKGVKIDSDTLNKLKDFQSIFITAYIAVDNNSSTNNIQSTNESMLYASNLMSLITDICQYNNVGFEVTMDMANVFNRAGLKTDGEIHYIPYRQQPVEKMIFATSDVALQALLMIDKFTANQF